MTCPSTIWLQDVGTACNTEVQYRPTQRKTDVTLQIDSALWARPPPPSHRGGVEWGPAALSPLHLSSSEDSLLTRPPAYQGIRRYSKSVASLRYRYMTSVVKYFERVAPNQTVLL